MVIEISLVYYLAAVIFDERGKFFEGKISSSSVN